MSRPSRFSKDAGRARSSAPTHVEIFEWGEIFGWGP